MNINLFKFSLYSHLKNLKALIIYPSWYLKRKSKKFPDNHLYKMSRIRDFKNKYNFESFIETGTFYGQTTRFASKIFKNVVSIEIYEPLFLLNKELFRKYLNVEILFGDSKHKLEDAIKITNGSTLFWLDGHYSGNGTGIGDAICPILQEIETIKKYCDRSFTIIVDDKRLFNGKDSYPKIDEFKSFIEFTFPNSHFFFDKDAIIIEQD
tara:strand:+ start:760 stop:1386 length:627 start_codon:yes stop_codon:yes gene_type:complete